MSSTQHPKAFFEFDLPEPDPLERKRLLKLGETTQAPRAPSTSSSALDLNNQESEEALSLSKTSSGSGDSLIFNKILCSKADALDDTKKKHRGSSVEKTCEVGRTCRVCNSPAANEPKQTTMAGRDLLPLELCSPEHKCIPESNNVDQMLGAQPCDPFCSDSNRALSKTSSDPTSSALSEGSILEEMFYSKLAAFREAKKHSKESPDQEPTKAEVSLIVMEIITSRIDALYSAMERSKKGDEVRGDYPSVDILDPMRQ